MYHQRKVTLIRSFRRGSVRLAATTRPGGTRDWSISTWDWGRGRKGRH